MANQDQHIRKRDRIRGLFNRSINVTDRSLLRSSVQQHNDNAQGQSLHASQPRQDGQEQSNTSIPSSSDELRLRILQNATKDLDSKDREIIEAYRSSTSDISNVLNDVHDHCKNAERLCTNKRWTFAFHGRTFKLKDQVEQVIKWMDRFKQVGDIMVNASPLYAGLPWAGVRFLLEAMTIEKSTVGALMTGLGSVSYMMTRLDIYLNYLDRVQSSQAKMHLEESLTRFYKIILEFLVLAISIFRQSTVSRTFSSFWKDQDILHFEARCDELANRVEVDAHNCDREEGKERFEMIQNQLSELENLRSLSDSIEGILVKLEYSERAKILEWVSQVSYIDNHHAARTGTTDNTANWIFDRSEYQDWENSPQSMILWLHGIPGAGKTKLTANVVHHFLNPRSVKNNRLAYFYCNRNEESRRDPLQVLCCFIKQLSQDNGAIHESVVDKYREKESTGFASKWMSYEEAEIVLLELIRTFSSPTILVLDALDECVERSRRNLLRTLNGFAESLPRLKIFISSRRDNDLKRQLEKESNVGIEAAENQNDIATFVCTRIKEDEKERPQPISDEMKNKIVKMLLEKSQGMFQWAVLQVEQLLNFKRERDIGDYLYRLPEDLTDAYHEIFESIRKKKGSEPEIAMRTFQWIIGSVQPLETDALVAAVCQDFNREIPQDPDIDMEIILSACRNLVVTVRGKDHTGSERWTCQLSHLSVREYLEDQYEEKVQESHKLVAKVYLSLLLNSLQMQSFLEAIKHGKNFLRPLHELYLYAMFLWPNQMRAILSSENDTVCDVDTLLHRFLISGNTASGYYKVWVKNMVELERYIPIWWDPSATRQLKELHTCLSLDFSSDVLLAICAFGFNNLLKEFLNIGGYNADESKTNYSLPLSLALKAKYISCVRTLIKKGADVNMVLNRGEFGNALEIAARSGDTAVVQLLLDNKADVNIQSSIGHYGSALAAAGWSLYSDNTAVVQLLIENGADINMQLNQGEYGSALAAAAAAAVSSSFSHNTAVVQLLIENGADINMQLNQGEYGSALAAAAAGIYSRILPVVQLLLNHGADVNMQLENGQYTSALTAAAVWHHTELMKLLLNNGGDVNSSCQSHGTVLNYLVQTYNVGHDFLKEQLRCMVGQHVDISGRTTLHFAALGGDIDVFEYLRSIGSDPTVQDLNGYDSIDYACIGGSLEILNLLLDGRPPLDSPGRKDNQWTPLHWAFRNGRPDIIEKLVVEQGFRNDTMVTTSQPDMQWSPVSIAIIHGKEDILEALSETCKALLGLTTSESNTNDVKNQVRTEEYFWLNPFTSEEKFCKGCFRIIHGRFFRCFDCKDDINFCFMCKSFLDIGHSDHNWEYIEWYIEE